MIYETVSFINDYDHLRILMYLEEHTDITEGMFLTGQELDEIEEMERRFNTLIDVGVIFGMEAEERLRTRVLERQEVWSAALHEVMSLCVS